MALQEASASALETILQEINECGDNKLKSNETYIKDWMACQAHLPKNYDERIVRSFLRGCKHDIERTKKKLDMYFTVRSTCPELFNQRNPLSLGIQQTRRVLKVCPLPKLTPEGSRVTLYQLQPHEISQFNATNTFKYGLMIGDIRIVEEAALSGDIFLFDVGNASAAHMAKLSVPVLRKVLMCAQEAYPQRLKQIHIINAPNLIDKFVTLFKSFMKEKMRNRFFVHSSVEELQKFVPLDVLPTEYGGSGPSTETLDDQWGKKLESYKSWFEQEESVKIDESLRANKPVKTNQEMFGFEGTFRRLSID